MTPFSWHPLVPAADLLPAKGFGPKNSNVLMSILAVGVTPGTSLDMRRNNVATIQQTSSATGRATRQSQGHRVFIQDAPVMCVPPPCLSCPSSSRSPGSIHHLRESGGHPTLSAVDGSGSKLPSPP